MNKLDKAYHQLVQDILDYGVEKKDRTGTGTKSIFGYTIRHKMSDGFPLLTTKKMHWKSIVTELLWFLNGRTDLRWLLEQDNTIWVGDAYKAYRKHMTLSVNNGYDIDRNSLKSNEDGFSPYTQEEFINKIKTDDEFAKKWGELGPIYGKQWREWSNYRRVDSVDEIWSDYRKEDPIDQIQNLIHDLKTNPDSRRLMVNAWNVGELDQMVLPPCHYGFQVYTRELSLEERCDEYIKRHPKETNDGVLNYKWIGDNLCTHEDYDKWNIPTRAISLMWNQRSVDVGLGLPFNIASYGLLLEIIAKITNMVPDELIGNLGDTHLYLNHIEPIKEQFGRDYTLEERLNMVSEEIQKEFSGGIVNLPNFPNTPVWSDGGKMSCLDDFGVPRRTREPYPLPKLVHMKTDEFWNGFDVSLFGHLDPKDFTLENYQSHPTIKLPLSN